MRYRGKLASKMLHFRLFQILPFLNIYKYVNNGLKPLYFPLINPSVGILSDEYKILTQYFHIFVIFTLKIKKKTYLLNEF